MPRLSITLPKDVYQKVMILSNENDDSLSATIARMTDLGLSYYQNSKTESSVNLASVEEHCYKLIIQVNAIIKSLAAEKLGYTQTDFDKLRDASILKFNDLIGIKREDL